MKGKEKRMAGDYEIIQSVYVGDKEVVLGENPADTSDGKYLCSFCQHSDLVALHQDLFISDNYLEVMKIFGERIVQQAEKVRQELSAAEAQGVSTVPLSAADCIPLSPSDDLTGKIIVIRAEVLRQEYQTVTHQLKYCGVALEPLPIRMAPPFSAQTFFPGRKAVLSGGMCWGPWNRKCCPIGRSGVLPTSNRKPGSKRTGRRGEMRENQGYHITDSIQIGDVEFVAGELAAAPNSYVTWECKNGDDYFWGHYFSDRLAAKRDLLERASQELQHQERMQKRREKKERER